ncbi:translation machinery-associated protein 16-like [Dysidea avara]|uniref:translation machinery-associated protein 16-like n=1 Tax=Dysidea avara TaxID=196820 RepID=UPI003331D8E1
MPKVPALKGHTRNRPKRDAIHPNSRKAGQLSRDQAHKDRVDKRKAAYDTAVSNKVTKLMWFREHIDDSKDSYSYGETVQLIEKYLGRLDGELDTILEQQGLPHQKGRRHASREDQIRSTMLQERHLLEGPGFEAPDLTDPKVLKAFKSWWGEEHLLPNLKLRKYRSRPSDDSLPVLNDDNM